LLKGFFGVGQETLFEEKTILHVHQSLAQIFSEKITSIVPSNSRTQNTSNQNAYRKFDKTQSTKHPCSKKQVIAGQKKAEEYATFCKNNNANEQQTTF